MQRSGRPKQPTRSRRDNAALTSRGAAEAAPELPFDDSQLALRAYDDFPYDSHSFPLTHPERLATIATLFGMQPVPVERARVLELGCSSGGNLIPMASTMPGATFLGYDLSGVQVRQAGDLIGALGIRNVTVEQRNILEVSEGPDRFDYIICHGVFSWVPENVQERIFSICSESLNPNGVALISYNTYPGWHMRESIREMMRYHARQFDDPKTQVVQSRALLDFLVKSVDAQKSPYGMHLAGELKLLSATADSYIAHEHLEHWNAPAYFHQFIERAARHDLQYLGESEFSTMVVQNLAAQVAETLSKGIRDVIRMEQYMDFVRNRAFRLTLLCHKERALDRNVDSSRLFDLQVAALAEPIDAKADVRSSLNDAFKTPGGIQFQTTAPLTKAALRILSAAWPRAIPFSELVGGALQMIGVPSAPDASRRLATDILQLYAAGTVELHSMPSAFTTSVSKAPRAGALARLQAARGSRVTNVRHESLALNDVERQLLILLDGTLGREQVIERLLAAVESGQLQLKRGDQPIIDRADQLEQVGRFYDQLLPHLGRKALLAA
jgi:methyltransferase-like protein/cyclopropane fatty-acyl-phospholipid synthase-like methyltransferase